jgi:hypothetical protein
MKIVLKVLLFLLLIFTGCTKDPEIIKGFYDSLHFIRQGGGQIEFNLYTTESLDKLNAIITAYSFRDTTIQYTIENNDEISIAFSALNQALNNQLQINGDFQQSTRHTGTWAYIYLVADNKETEVTNTELRNSLIRFEELLRDKIQK